MLVDEISYIEQEMQQAGPVIVANGSMLNKYDSAKADSRNKF